MSKHTSICAACTVAALAVAQPTFAADYEVSVVNLTRGIHFTPLLVAAHPGNVSLFTAGEAASTELATMAEGGDTAGLNAVVESISGVAANGAGLLAPGQSETFTVSNTATPANDHLSIVGMLLPTNDGFVGLNTVQLPAGEVGTTVTFTALGYDAGSEANDEIVGSGALGEAGFPAPPPVMATGVGTGGTGVAATAEGVVHVHRNNLGDTDSAAGSSDISSTVHRWLNPVARITVTITAN